MNTKLAGEEWQVGDRVSWQNGAGAYEGRVVRVAFKSGRDGDLVFDASDAAPRYIVETDDGRRAAYRGHTLTRAIDRANVARPADKDEQMILVDARDRATGTGEKLLVHREGLLHRAFSVFIFDRRGRLLLQKRAAAKYHSAGLWSNTACGHPRPGEGTTAAARRRLREEMNVECGLREAFSFVYRAQVGGLIEHEYDHVLIGTHEGEPAPDPSEVDEWRWIGLDDLRAGLQREPEQYSYWLRIAVENDYWLKSGAIPTVG